MVAVRLRIVNIVMLSCALVLGSSSSLIGAQPAPASPFSSAAALHQAIERAATTSVLPRTLEVPLADASSDLFELGSGITHECLVGYQSSTALGTRPSDAVCTFGDRSSRRVVVLFGDSHATMWVPALNLVGIQRHFKVLVVARASCFVASIDAWDWSKNAPSPACSQFRKWAIQHIQQVHPSTVILSDASDGYQRDTKYHTIPQATWAAS